MLVVLDQVVVLVQVLEMLMVPQVPRPQLADRALSTEQDPEQEEELYQALQAGRPRQGPGGCGMDSFNNFGISLLIVFLPDSDCNHCPCSKFVLFRAP